MSRGQKNGNNDGLQGRTHPICVDAGPFVVTENELDKTRKGRTFVRKQSVRNSEMHHGV